MAEKIEITLNGKKVFAENREPLIAVCEREGVYIPALCHHYRLEPYGACRICLSKVTWDKKSKYVTSCNYPVESGDVIDTESDDVIQLRKLSIEALLGRCPSEKKIVEFAREHGVTESRFPPAKPGGDDCILCGLCVRVCDEVVGARALGFMSRGPEREVSTPFLVHPESCIGCGACSALCPTTRMKMEKEKVTVLLTEHGDTRPCRYALMGFFPGGICANSYQCYKCDIDQKYRELAGDEHPIFMARPVGSVSDGGEVD
ncbi:MAG TPA: 4Fe-4S dicluster domain-containing protein [Firmicutes bacterium]|nr:4Fe-4S dicluster domain-containing protein [Bacillota bacterium]